LKTTSISSCESRDNSNAILAYWGEIQKGLGVSDKVRRVYRKLVSDLNNKNSEWVYSPARADHAITFIEKYCRHIKADLGGTPFILELWQRAFISAVFGFVHKETGVRKYREVILMVARKNGKSLLGSAIGLYMMVADGEPGPEVVSVATKRDQAKIIWKAAKQMVKKSPVLKKRIKMLVAELVSDFNDGSFIPLCSDSDTLDGLNVHCSLIDELHAIKDKNLYDVVIDGMSARSQPLSVITTTAGTIREGIFDIKYDECERIINGYDDELGYHDERVLPIIYELDKRNEWTDEKAWGKANPGLGTIKSIDQLKQKVLKAQADSLLVKNLVTKDFNVRETVGGAWLSFEEVNNKATFDLMALKPRYGIGGVDLSQSVDLTAAKVLFMVPGDEHVYSLGMYWLPEDLLEARSREDKIPYDQWHKQGLLRTCPGNKIHYSYVVQWFEEVRDEYDLYLPWIGYDAYSAEYFVEEMRLAFGKSAMIPIPQTFKVLSAPMKVMGADLAAKLVNYNNNPIDKWCLTNTAIQEDRKLNIQPCKTQNRRRRIDGAAAMLDAYVVLQEKMIEYRNLI